MKLSRKTIEICLRALLYYHGGEWYEHDEEETITTAEAELEAALKEIGEEK